MAAGAAEGWANSGGGAAVVAWGIGKLLGASIA